MHPRLVVIENVVNGDPCPLELGPAPPVDDLRFEHGSGPQFRPAKHPQHTILSSGQAERNRSWIDKWLQGHDTGDGSRDDGTYCARTSGEKTKRDRAWFRNRSKTQHARPDRGAGP